MDHMRERLGHALTDPGEELSRWGRFLRFQFALWRFCVRRLKDHNVTAMSAALSFRTIFALIPILVFAFLVLQSIGVIKDSKESLRNILEVSGFSQVQAVQSWDDIDAPPAVSGSAGGAVSPADSGGPATAMAETNGLAAVAAPEDQPVGGDSTAARAEPEVYNVAAKIEEIFAGVEGKLTFARMGPIGGALLVWTAITLLTTMEHSLNRIFGAPRSRSLLRRVLLYWSVVTLGPVALATAEYAGRSTLALVEHMRHLGWLLAAIGWTGPIIVAMLVVAALYKLLPNTRVRYRAAIGGAVVAVPLWLTARWAFALYVEQFVVKGSLYGVLGVLPLFLLWLNLSWLVFLFGAELAHTATNLNRMQLAERVESIVIGPSDILAAALAVARRFEAGKGASEVDDVAEAINLPTEIAATIMSRLASARILCAVEASAPGGFTLARPAGKIAVSDVLEVGDPPPRIDAEQDGDIAAGVGQVRGQLRAALEGKALGELLG